MFQAATDSLPQVQPPVQTVPGVVIDDARLAVLLDEIIVRINELKLEMGLLDHGKVEASSWMDIRRINELQYENEFDWRVQYYGLHSIFQQSNFSLNLSKRWARLVTAKATEDIVGTEPFFGIVPTEIGDPQLAKDSEWYVQEEVSHSEVSTDIGEAQRIAVVRNECTVKIYHRYEATYYTGPATVACGPCRYFVGDEEVIAVPDEPITTPDGDYIYEMDDMIPDPQVEGLARLAKDLRVAFRADSPMQWVSKPNLEQKLVRRDEVATRPLDYRDFLCPLTVPSIHDADTIAHLFDEEIGVMKELYAGVEVADGYRNFEPQSGAQTAKEDKGEKPGDAVSRVVNRCHYAHVFRRCDVLGDGRYAEIEMVIDLGNTKVVWYDYLGNQGGRRPFEVIPGIEHVPNRWYGVGVFEMLDHKQLYVDTQFNRVNFKSTKTASLRFRNKNAVDQWRANQPMTVGDGNFLDIIDDNFDARNPPAFAVNLTEIDENAMHLLELMLQASSTEVGIVGPDDGQTAGLNSTKLATGIKALERTGNVLMKYTEKAQGKAITAILYQVLMVVLDNMHDEEIVYNPKAQTLVNLNKNEVRRIAKRVKLLLTRSRSTETIETARMVIQLCREYYEALNPLEQMKLRNEYIRQLKAMEVQDPDELLDVVTQEQVDQWLLEQQEAAKLPPKTSIATKYPDLARSEQVAVLKREGIPPASDQEIEQERLKHVAEEKALAEATQPDKEKELEMKQVEHEQKMEHTEEKHDLTMRHQKEKATASDGKPGSGTAKKPAKSGDGK